MGRHYVKSNKSKITTKTAISKRELRSARKYEEGLINQSTSTVREPKIKEIEMSIKNIDVTCGYTNEDIISNYEGGKSIVEIANKFGITNELVLSVIIPYLYTNGSTIAQINEKLGLGPYHIRKILKAENVQMRPRGFQPRSTEEVQEEKTSVEENESVTESSNEAEKIKEDSGVSRLSFCNQIYSDSKLHKVKFDMFSEETVVAGLCRNRHDIPMVSKYIFDTVTEKEFKNPHYLENRAKGFINAYVKTTSTMKAKTLVLYCTGLQLPLSALIKVCVEMQVNLITMHWDPGTESYIPQNTLTIFGKVPDIAQISPLDNLKKRFLGGVYTYHCNIKDLIKQEKCCIITLNAEDNNDNSAIIFDKDFPDAEVWEIYSEFIKMSRNESVENKQHSILLSQINVSLAGYQFGDTISKSYNFKGTQSKTYTIR